MRPSILIFILALALYALMAGERLTGFSVAPHFSFLAQAWLDGHAHLTEPLPSTYDLIRYQGLWYVAQPPLPALMMLPFIRLVPDVLFTVLLGAMNVALCEVILRLYLPALPSRRRMCLVIFFGFGTAHGYMSAFGTVWFTGQIAAVSCFWVFLLGVKWEKPWLTGLGLAGMLLARPAVIFGMGMFYVGWLWGQSPRLMVRALAISVLPLVLAGLFLGWYNHIRFESPFDFGYEHLEDAPNIRERRLEHGLFSPVFFPENLYTATLRPPLWEKREPNPWGMGIVWTSPVLFYAFLAQDKKRVWVALSFALIMLFPLLYHNSGSAQFGYRFVLDGLPLFMLVVGDGARRGHERWLILLTLWSVLIHGWGYLWFYPIIVA